MSDQRTRETMEERNRQLDEALKQMTAKAALLEAQLQQSLAEAESEPAALTVPQEPFPDSPFADHRRALNESLIQIKKDAAAKVTGKCSRDDTTIACSSVRWQQVQSVYDQRLKKSRTAFPVYKSIDPKSLQPLLAELRRHRQTLGSNKLSECEMRQKLSVTTLLVHVAQLFPKKQTENEEGDEAFDARDEPDEDEEDDEDIELDTKLVMEAPLKHRSLLSIGKPDVLLKRNDRKVIVVECKKDDILQGQAQDLLMMDLAVADNEEQGVKATPVFGIVSTFTEWIFYRYEKKRIWWMEDSINETFSMGKDVKRIVGIVYNMLDQA